MTSFQTGLSEHRRAGTRFINDIRRGLQKAYAEENDANGLNQSEIGRRLGIHRSVVHRELKGVENITLRRAGELAWAMGRRAVVSFVPIGAPADSNHGGFTIEIKMDISARVADVTNRLTVRSDNVIPGQENDAAVPKAA